MVQSHQMQAFCWIEVRLLMSLCSIKRLGENLTMKEQAWQPVSY